MFMESIKKKAIVIGKMYRVPTPRWKRKFLLCFALAKRLHRSALRFTPVRMRDEKGYPRGAWPAMDDESGRRRT